MSEQQCEHEFKESFCVKCGEPEVLSVIAVDKIEVKSKFGQ